MGGGALRGPVAHDRQTKTIRFMQALLAVIGLGLVVFASTTIGSSSVHIVGGQHDPGLAQPVVLFVLAVAAFGTALALGGRSGVRIPTPARLDELVGRAELAAVQRAEQIASEHSDDPPVEDSETNQRADS
jgi:hypothetical protein